MQKQITIQPPAVPGGPVTVIETQPGVPMTKAELNGLRARRSEISSQLVSAQNRRKSLANQLLGTDPAARAGIEGRLKVLDDRIIRLEQELDRTGELLMNVPAVVLAETAVPARIASTLSGAVVPVSAIVTIFFLFPIAMAAARLLWKRGSAPRVTAPDAATQQRLDQLQQAVDTIAVEVERISEGQRYVTRLLNDRTAAKSALPSEIA